MKKFLTLAALLITIGSPLMHADITIVNTGRGMQILRAEYENKNKVPSPFLPPIYLESGDVATVYTSLNYFGGKLLRIEANNKMLEKPADGMTYTIDNSGDWGIEK
ncbi:hypothetical protein CVU75_01310 [Candidatus Dependentiae bacterium HGW-Dependentiae-1]|nr:MAG: hypothetical protein CVU75_01310 [Candidatus Dependentiae bacterium HGW-Dependentiae-1]